MKDHQPENQPNDPSFERELVFEEKLVWAEMIAAEIAEYRTLRNLARTIKTPTLAAEMAIELQRRRRHLEHVL